MYTQCLILFIYLHTPHTITYYTITQEQSSISKPIQTLASNKFIHPPRSSIKCMYAMCNIYLLPTLLLHNITLLFTPLGSLGLTREKRLQL